MFKDIKDIQAQLEAAVEGLRTTELKVSNAAAEVSSGDLFVFPIVSELSLEWCVILPHPDDRQLWFVVPADQNPIVGTWDVLVPGSTESGPLNLRCSRGLWIHADDFDPNCRSGFVESPYVQSACEKLSQMVSGEMSSDQVMDETDEDPDYEEWFDEVSEAVESLERRFRENSPVPIAQLVRLADFDRTWRDKVRAGIRRDLAMLAADSGGLASGPKDPFPVLLGTILQIKLAGTVVLLKEDDGLRLRYFPAANENYPEVKVILDSGEQSQVFWRTTPAASFESVDLISQDRRIELEFVCTQRVVVEP